MGEPWLTGNNTKLVGFAALKLLFISLGRQRPEMSSRHNHQFQWRNPTTLVKILGSLAGDELQKQIAS